MAVAFDRDRPCLPDGRRAFRKRRRSAATALPGLIAAAALLPACGSHGGTDPIGSTATAQASNSVDPTLGGSTTETPHADDTADGPRIGPPAFPERTGPQTGRGSGEVIVLTDVRVAEREGFDRIVLEFSGTGTPGWAVKYVDEAALEGSGDIVTLGGDATLDISASNTTWPASDYYSGPKRLKAEGGDTPEVYVAGTFEGYTQVLAGIDGPRAPFRVYVLTEPSRLVIDVVDDNVG